MPGFIVAHLFGTENECAPAQPITSISEDSGTGTNIAGKILIIACLAAAIYMIPELGFIYAVPLLAIALILLFPQLFLVSALLANTEDILKMK